MLASTRALGMLSGRLSKWPVLLLVFALSFLYFLIGITRVVDVADEGIPVYGAQRVLDGEVPYRDFWTIYAPGQFYVLAGLFKAFGSSILVERLYDTVVRALISTEIFIIILRLASPVWGIVSWLIVTLWLKYFGYYGYPNFPTMFFSLASLYLLLDFFRADRPKTRLFLAGTLTGLAGLFRQDSGFYLLLSELFVILAFAFFHLVPKNGGTGLFKRLVKLGPFALAYLVGVALPVFPVGLYFLSAVPARELANDLILFPLNVFPVVRAIPFPGPLPYILPLIRGEDSLFLFLARLSERWSFYFSILALAAALAFFISDKRRRRERRAMEPPAPVWNWQLGLFFIFGCFSFNTVRVRSDLPHLLPLFVSAALLSSALGSRAVESDRIRKGFVLGAFILMGGLLVIFPIYRWRTLDTEGKYRSLFLGHNLIQARGVKVNPNQTEAIHYIQSVTFPWERIFVGNNRHDMIYNNDIMFYFLSERHSATKYHELFPGWATSRAVQTKIIEDLQRNNVRFIIRLSRFRNPGVTTEPVPVRLLDEFIEQNYEPVRKFGDWSVWKIQ